jgi:hypothetical protein
MARMRDGAGAFTHTYTSYKVFPIWPKRVSLQIYFEKKIKRKHEKISAIEKMKHFTKDIKIV